MSEFIGSRISLISKSDIRYAGTLHDINSENSTVALENVTSFGTEGRRGNPDDEVPASDQVYEYIVFRGSDVKDLRIEEPPKENKPPQMPNDPAILGGSRPPTQNAPPGPQGPPQGPRQQQPPFNGAPQFPYQQYPPHPQQRFGGPPGAPGPGFQGPPGYGYPGMPPYGAPPGWFPPGQGFNGPPGPFPPHHQGPPFGGPAPQQQGPPQHQQHNQQQQRGPPPQADTPSVEQPKEPQPSVDAQRAVAKVSAPDAKDKPTAEPEAFISAAQSTATPPVPPVESKPNVAQALAPAASGPQLLASTKTDPTPTGPKSNRIVPAVPFQQRPQKPVSTPSASQLPTATPAQPSDSKSGNAAATAALQYQNATQAATAAVAAAMAKLPPVGGQTQQNNDPMDNLTKKVNEMRTDDRIRHSRQPGTGGFAAGHRGGGRGGKRGGREPQQDRGLEVPATDFDFESANAQFKKQDVVKEAIASGSPLGSPTNGEAPILDGNADTDGAADVVIPAATGASYNRSSFFDDISSELKDREEITDARGRGGMFRNEERRRNMETFGMSSVDGGFRGGFRGRGRGRGNFRGGYGRGGGGPRGGYRGARGGGDAVITAGQ